MIDEQNWLVCNCTGGTSASSSLIKNFACQNSTIIKSRLLAVDYQWPWIVILMKPPLQFVRNRCSTVIACCFSSWMNTRPVFNTDRKKGRERECAGVCVSETSILKKRVRLSNSAEKSSGSYYLVVFNWDLIDPSIIHRDCQWAVYAVYATSVSLSFHGILTMKYNLCFFLCCVAFLFISFPFLSFRFPYINLIAQVLSCYFSAVLAKITYSDDRFFTSKKLRDKV